MRLRERIADKGRTILSSQLILKWSTDDRAKRAAEAVFDMRGRVREAWEILLNGHALPAIDPALDDSIGQTEEQFSRSRVSDAVPLRSNGNGKSAATAQVTQGSDDMDESLKERGTIASLGGRDVFQKCLQFKAADNARKMGSYPYFRPLDFNDGPEAQVNGKRVTMFGSNNYLGPNCSHSEEIRCSHSGGRGPCPRCCRSRGEGHSLSFWRSRSDRLDWRHILEDTCEHRRVASG